jgi:hypothetical protein
LEPRPVTQGLQTSSRVVDLHEGQGAPVHSRCQTIFLEFSNFES